MGRVKSLRRRRDVDADKSKRLGVIEVIHPRGAHRIDSGDSREAMWLASYDSSNEFRWDDRAESLRLEPVHEGASDALERLRMSACGSIDSTRAARCRANPLSELESELLWGVPNACEYVKDHGFISSVARCGSKCHETNRNHTGFHRQRVLRNFEKSSTIELRSQLIRIEKGLH